MQQKKHRFPCRGQRCHVIERMDYSGVDAAMTWIQLPYIRDELDIVQKNLYEKSKLYPKRFYPVGWADPTLGVDIAIDTVKRCMEEYGFYGVKLNGKQNDFRIDDPKNFYARCGSNS